MIGGFASVIARIGGSDCEALRDGLLAQPINAVTSLAYVVAGIGIVAMAGRTGRERLRSGVFAASLAAVGVGSLMYHGPQPSGAELVHDLPIVVTLLFIANHDVHRARSSTVELGSFVGVSAVAAAVMLVDAGTARILTGVAVVAAVLAELSVSGRRLRPIEVNRTARASLTVGAVLGVGSGTWILGRTGGPACDPGSVLQFHGLWHIASAAGAALWWSVALGRLSSRPPHALP